MKPNCPFLLLSVTPKRSLRAPPGPGVRELSAPPKARFWEPAVNSFAPANRGLERFWGNSDLQLDLEGLMESQMWEHRVSVHDDV